MPTTLDSTDRYILERLQEDARTNIKELADALNMTKTPVYERIRKLEKEGIITQYVALLDSAQLDKKMVVFCTVLLESQKLENIEQFTSAVQQIPEVQECYLMGGSSDFLLKVLVKDLEAYHQFSSGKLAALPHVSQIQSSFVLNEVKHTTKISL